MHGHPPASHPPPHHFPSSYPQPMYPSPYMSNGPPRHFLYHPSPIQGGQPPPMATGGFIRGPKPFSTTLGNTNPVNLNPSALPFTPLQVSS